MENREITINNFIELLECDSLEQLTKSHDLYIKHHDFLPISIINYGKIFDIKKTKNIDACRGLIIDVNTHKIISRGFDRFIPKYQNPKNKINVKRATIKEDGSLIFMFKYENKWHLSTMHDFADNILPFNSKMTYSDLFLQIINQPLDTFAESIINQFSESKDEIITFCFEMCSEYNRVIRDYIKPCLYLISAFGGTNGSKEFSINSRIILPLNVQHIKELDFLENSNLTFEQLQQKVIEMTKEDITFEGFVLQTDSGERVKVKNPLYLTQHKLKYRSWSKCTPDLIIPLILNNTCDKVISNVKMCLNGEPIFCEEVDKRIDKYKEILNADYDSLKFLIENALLIKSISEFIAQIESLNKTYFNMYKSLIIKVFNTKIFTKEMYYDFVRNNIVKLYSGKDYFTDEHSNKSCDFNYSATECQDIIDKFHNEGISTDNTKCYCGENMKVVRLGYDLTRYKICHCGKKYGYTIYKSGTYLQVCSNNKCLCTHEVNQLTKIPLGYPANIYCKSLRLIIHELIFNSSVSKEECYKQISLITGKTKEDTHMAKFGISDCIKVLQKFNK